MRCGDVFFTKTNQVFGSDMSCHVIFNRWGLLVVLAASLLGCRVDTPKKSSGSNATLKSPYKFLRSKKERDNRDVMELFAFSGKFNQQALVEFCRSKKNNNKANGFYYAVIFDNAENAKFPTSPFTAQFGGDDESMKHIRAIYEYNRVNGFSELTYYDSNMWSGKATRVKL